MNPEVPWIIFGSLSMLGLGGWLLRPLVLGLARRLEGRGHDTEMLAEMDELRAQVRELDGVQHRIAELEDRVDFTERMLAATKAEAARVEGGRP
jgi:hypothetical protein